MKKWTLVIVSLSLVLSACSPRQEKVDPIGTDSGGNATEAGLPLELPEIADLEVGVWMEVTIPEEMRTENIEVLEERVKTRYITWATINVRPPYPETLPVQMKIVSGDSFDVAPVAVIGKVSYEDKRIAGTIAGTLGKRIGRVDPTATFDALAGFEDIPESFSLAAEAFATVLEPGTDPASVDLTTLKVPRSKMATLTANSIRINFLPSEGGTDETTSAPSSAEG